MKYLWMAFVALGLVSFAFAFRTSDIPVPAPNTDLEGARGLSLLERRCRGISVGIVALAFGFYFLERERTSQRVAHISSTLLLTRSRICPKCGRPSRRSECLRGKQFGFIPRRLCPECGGYVEQSAARILALGFALLFWAILGAFAIQGAPDFVLAPACISAPLGAILFGLGLVVFDRQFRRVKHYISTREKSTLA